MPWALALALLLGAAAPPKPLQPSEQLLVYYNARMALSEGRPREALQLWMLRTAIESRTGLVSAHDQDLRSVTWAALGRLGLCPDGFSRDDDGAGLWPLAMHNWTLRNLRGPATGAGPSPYEAFAVGRQQRAVSLGDVLDLPELTALQLRRGRCLAGPRLLYASGHSPIAGLRDRRVAARVLRHLLRQAQGTLAAERTVGRSVIAARLFDLNLRLAGLAQRARRRAQRMARRRGRQAGLSRPELAEHVSSDSSPELDPNSEEARILRASLDWPASEWMALSSARRQILFAHAARHVDDPDRVRPLALAILDELTAAGAGGELATWIAHATAGGAATREVVWRAERGRRLLSQDRAAGFRGRAALALHRGVEQLATGDLAAAIRSLAHALSWSEGALGGEDVRRLARRWLSYVASQFQVTDELFAVLKAVVPRGDYAAVLEDQLWHAALGADRASFQRCVDHQVGRGALRQRVELLGPLAAGDASAFVAAVAEQLESSPHFARRFLRQLCERLSIQDADVRRRHVPTLAHLRELLEQQVEGGGGGARQRRAVEGLVAQLRSLLAGVPDQATLRQAADRAQALSPKHEVFAGSLRLAPSDPLPWPFVVAPVEPPSVFTPISLRPVQWRDDAGRLVFGWKVGE